MEFDYYYSPSETFVVLTADQFVGRDEEQHCVIPQTVPYSVQSRKLETTSTTKKQQYMKNSKVRFRLNVDVRKEMEDSRLNEYHRML